MKKYTIGLAGLLIILLVICIAVLHSRGPAKITLTNGSSITITNVQIDGGHFGQFIGTMTPGMTASFTLGGSGLNDVWVSYDANGQTFNSRGKKRPSYFKATSRHPLALLIGADLSVVPSSDIKTH